MGLAVVARKAFTQQRVGNFVPKDREPIVAHLGAMGVAVRELRQIIRSVLNAAERKTYRDDPLVMTVKALQAADRLNEDGDGPGE